MALSTASTATSSPETETVAFSVRSTPIGLALIAGTQRGVRAVLLGENADALEEELRRRFPGAVTSSPDAWVESLADDVVAAIEDPDAGAALPLDIVGTPFQQEVWSALRRIPPGETRTYGEIARDVDRPRSARAVASACAANPIAVLTPCHRVVHADGTVSGYRWGVSRKQELLRREGARP